MEQRAPKLLKNRRIVIHLLFSNLGITVCSLKTGFKYNSRGVRNRTASRLNLLSAKSEFLDKGTISLDVLVCKIIEKSTSLSDHLKHSAT